MEGALCSWEIHTSSALSADRSWKNSLEAPASGQKEDRGRWTDREVVQFKEDNVLDRASGGTWAVPVSSLLFTEGFGLRLERWTSEKKVSDCGWWETGHRYEVYYAERVEGDEHGQKCPAHFRRGSAVSKNTLFGRQPSRVPIREVWRKCIGWNRC